MGRPPPRVRQGRPQITSPRCRLPGHAPARLDPMMKVSVVIPARNEEHLLGAAWRRSGTRLRGPARDHRRGQRDGDLTAEIATILRSDLCPSRGTLRDPLWRAIRARARRDRGHHGSDSSTRATGSRPWSANTRRMPSRAWRRGLLPGAQLEGWLSPAAPALLNHWIGESRGS